MLKYIITLTSLVVLLEGNNADVYKTACIENNATACYKYGLPLVSGKNAKVQDIREEGMSFIRKSCILGYGLACDIMGERYYNDKNYRVAKPYLEESCERGVIDACEALGTMYRDGHEVRADDVKSRIYYEKACDLHSGDACYAVAIIYRGGFGVEKNREKEKAFYKKGCDSGLKAGCDRYSELDNEDKGIETGIWATFKSWFK
ncbi:MAG: tetratricopeptide repeat protein [Campylobacterota bacterium]|nr:tetratricopeptide repeat protein [Campylobacterota bacterium]